MSSHLHNCEENSSVEATAIKNNKNLILQHKMEIKWDCMPRCSSFKNLSTLQQEYEQSEKNTNYCRWKQALEGDFKMRSNQIKPNWWQRLDAISGHLTPKGHPSFTYKDLTSIQCNRTKQNQMEFPSMMNFNDSLRAVPKATASAAAAAAAATISSQRQEQTTIKSILTSLNVHNLTIKSLYRRRHRHRLVFPLLPLPSLTHLTYSEQAKIIERLYSDIKKFEKSLSS